MIADLSCCFAFDYLPTGGQLRKTMLCGAFQVDQAPNSDPTFCKQERNFWQHLRCKGWVKKHDVIGDRRPPEKHPSIKFFDTTFSRREPREGVDDITRHFLLSIHKRYIGCATGQRFNSQRSATSE